MLRNAALVAATASVASAHSVLCALSNPLDGVGCVPEWVAKYSTPLASGPEQLWINFGATADAMVIGWITADMNAGSQVQYGLSPDALTNTTSGSSDYYTYGQYTSGLIHHTTLTGLAAGKTYYYRCGDASAWSGVYNFSVPGVGKVYPYTFAAVADMGESSDASSSVAHVLANMNGIDSVLFAGDLSYASGCESGGCTVWDAFQRLMQPLAAYKPVAINIGNHELDDFANGIPAISAQYRFAGMPSGGRKDGALYFSYNSGPAHIISLCSFYGGGYGASSPMTTWLQADLAAIDRSVTPWVIVMVHAPWYNSNTNHQGDGEPMRAAYEDMLNAAGVNVMFAGHVHAYERSFPTAHNGQVQPAGEGIVYFNIGDAGASLYTGWLPTPAWSAYHSATFGHGELQILNDTHAYFTWHRNKDSEPVVTDSTYVINTHAA